MKTICWVLLARGIVVPSMNTATFTGQMGGVLANGVTSPRLAVIVATNTVV